MYFDKLGNQTIGYGHLVKKNENFSKNKKYSKKKLEIIFNNDFKLSVSNFKKNYNHNTMSKNTQEVLIEMTFQLGIKNLLKFKKFNQLLKQKLFYQAALEMLDSKWHQQTPKRVETSIKILLGH